MKIKDIYNYKGNSISFEFNKNRKHFEYTAICRIGMELVNKHDDSFDGAKNQMELYIDNIPIYQLLYKKEEK